MLHPSVLDDKQVEYDCDGHCSPEEDWLLLTVTDVLTTCVVLIFGVKVSCYLYHVSWWYFTVLMLDDVRRTCWKGSMAALPWILFHYHVALKMPSHILPHSQHILPECFRSHWFFPRCFHLDQLLPWVKFSRDFLHCRFETFFLLLR